MIPPAKRGDRLNQDYVNRIIDQANRAERLTIPGKTVLNSRGGMVFGPSPIRGAFFDPCHMVEVVNTGTSDIEALTPAHIVGTSDKDAPPYSMDMLNRRVLEVHASPTRMHRRNHGVIMFDRTKIGEVGRAYIDGLCLAKITAASRRFLTFAGWKIIWEEGVAEVPSNAEHYAIVRYCGELGFWALLTAADQVDDNRWKYSWTEKEFIMSGSKLDYVTPASARVGPFTDETVGSTGYAWNSTEIENDDIDAAAGWSDETIIGTFDTLITEAINPIGQTSSGQNKWPVVWLEPLRLINSGQVAYLFAGWNTPRLSLGFTS